MSTYINYYLMRIKSKVLVLCKGSAKIFSFILDFESKVLQIMQFLEHTGLFLMNEKL